jgi:hypothetical protein
MGRSLAPAVLGLLLASASMATDAILSPPGQGGWQPLKFPKIDRQTTYTVVRTGGIEALKAESDCSASAMYLPLGKVDLSSTPMLHWRWKIEKRLRVGDERTKAGDDFAARTYVMFRFDPERASFWQRAQHALGSKLYGDVIPGNTINYVWSSREPPGSKWDNPFTGASKMVSVGTGPTSGWVSQVVDVDSDYRELFGHAPPPLLALAVMTDSDNSCQAAVAYYTDFRFVSR